MLQLKSFKFEEDKEMSEFLLTHSLHQSASVFTSEGKILIPYEDGMAPTTEQKIAELGGNRNLLLDKIGIIEHSNRVVEVEIIGIEKQIEENKAKLLPLTGKKEDKEADKVARDTNKDAMSEVRRLENIRDEKKRLIVKNQAELTNYHTNVAVYEETIGELRAKE